jgi:tyrosyl-tRNA synthetase
MTLSEQIDSILTRGVAEVIDGADLRAKLLAGKPLRIKLGIDPTSANIHIGRATVLWKMRAFQDLGHQVVFIVGDFTGIIGDTSDKDAERPMLDEATVQNNLATYFEQAFKILDPEKTETYYNSTWLKTLGFGEIGKLADVFSVHDFIARENIKKRLDAGKRVSLREVLYPLMQGYDSVAIKADVELGGTDQRFNLLAGRALQPHYGQTPQNILTMDLLPGTDGRKMSSSWGNVINLLDTPTDMFGKTMRVPDELLKQYFVAATNLPMSDIEAIVNSDAHPRDKKLQLAEVMVAQYYDAETAASERNKFIAQFSDKQLPEDIVEVLVPAGSYDVVDALVQYELVTSKSEARRMLEQGGVYIDQVPVTETALTLSAGDSVVLQVGKRKFVRLVVS